MSYTYRVLFELQYKDHVKYMEAFQTDFGSTAANFFENYDPEVIYTEKISVDMETVNGIGNAIYSMSKTTFSVLGVMVCCELAGVAAVPAAAAFTLGIGLACTCIYDMTQGNTKFEDFLKNIGGGLLQLDCVTMTFASAL